MTKATRPCRLQASSSDANEILVGSEALTKIIVVSRRRPSYFAYYSVFRSRFCCILLHHCYHVDNSFLREMGERTKQFFTVARAQALTGLVFFLFTALHLVTHSTVVFGQSTHVKILPILRTLYQHPLFEYTVIIASGLIHAGLGVARAVSRWRQSTGKRPLPAVVHTLTGLLLVCITPFHFAATRVLPALFWEQKPGFQFVTHSLQRFPFLFYPYYLLFTVAILYHSAYGLVRAMNLVFGARLPAGSWSQWRLVIVLSAVVAAVVLAGYAGLLYAIRTDELAAVDAYYGRVAAAFGIPNVFPHE